MPDTASSPHSPRDLSPVWHGFVDDAAIFPPGNADLADAQAAFIDRRSQWYDAFAGPLVITDTKLGALTQPLPVAVVVTGGAGALAPAAGLAVRHGHDLRAIEIALRDPDDLAGNARRVVAARSAAIGDGVLGEDTPVFVEIPPTGPLPMWLAAADVVAESDLRLKFRTGGLDSRLFPEPRTLAGWINGALDRETSFKCTAGLHQAVRHTASDTGLTHHGFLNVLVATARAFDTAAGIDEIEGLLAESDPAEVISAAQGTDLSSGRRWFTSFGSCSITEPLESLIATGLLEDL